MAGPRQIVDSPTFTSRPFGLLSVVQTPTANGPHWQNGVTWQSYCLADMGSVTYDECIATTGAPDGPVPEPSVKESNVDSVLRGATPFTPYVRFDCPPVGNDDARRVATDALARSEAWQVERAFWTGQVDGVELAFPHLAANAEVVDGQDALLQLTASPVATGAALDVVTGLGLLEQELADCYGGVGVIHVPAKLLPTLDAFGLLRPVQGRDVSSGQFGRQLQTLNGNLVAIGAGYPGTGPDGTDPGSDESWMYATGAVFMYRSDVKIHTDAQSLNRENNTLELIAERTYVLGWDCCLLAVLVQLGDADASP